MQLLQKQDTEHDTAILVGATACLRTTGGKRLARSPRQQRLAKHASPGLVSQPTVYRGQRGPRLATEVWSGVESWLHPLRITDTAQAPKGHVDFLPPRQLLTRARLDGRSVHFKA